MEREPGFTTIDFSGTEQFQSLRRSLGVTTFGMNVISLQPRQRLRIHRHARQEEAYVVLEGSLTLAIEEAEHTLEKGQAARVPPALKRQLSNRGSELCVVLALGGAEAHAGRDGEAFTSWDQEVGRSPQEVPSPDDLPA